MLVCHKREYVAGYVDYRVFAAKASIVHARPLVGKIGNWANSALFPAPCLMAKLAIYTAALSQSQVDAHYANV